MSVNGAQVREANFDLGECRDSTHSIHAGVINVGFAEPRLHHILAVPLLDSNVGSITDQNLWRSQISIVDT